MWSKPRWSLAAATCVLVGVLGAAHAGEPDPDDPVVLKKRLDSAQAEIATLRSQVDDLKGRFSIVEQRLGLVPFQPKALTPVNGLHLDYTGPAGSVYVESAAASPKKQKLGTAFKGLPGGVVALWATWCKPCTSDEELGRLRQLQGTLHGEGLQFISLAVDSIDKVRSDPRAPKWVYPLWQADDAHLDLVPRELVDTQGVKLPMFFVAGADGTIVAYKTGALDERTMAELVTAALQLRK